MDKELQTLIQRLRDNSTGCEDKCIDLQILKFEAKEGEMRLHNDFQNLWFKNDPKNPNDPKIVHALKQFCKLMGVPHPFFAKNPDHMKNQIVSCWLPTLKPEQAMVMMKLRKAKESGNIIRAVVPVEFANIPDADIMAMVGEAAGDKFRVEFMIGDGRDDLLLHVRFVSTEQFDVCGEKCSTGFSVVASELGGAPLSIETLLFRCESKGAMLASYGGEPYFQSNYEGIQPAQVRELFPRLIAQLTDQLGALKDRIYAAKDKVLETEDIKGLLRTLRLRKGLNDKFHTLLFQEIEAKPAENRWDFVNRMAVLAKDFPSELRVRIEKAAGELIDLIFEKA